MHTHDVTAPPAILSGPSHGPPSLFLALQPDTLPESDGTLPFLSTTQYFPITLVQDTGYKAFPAISVILTPLQTQYASVSCGNPHPAGCAGILIYTIFRSNSILPPSLPHLD